MKPAAARLLLLGTASSVRRLVAISAGVALGVGMLLVLVGAYTHMPARDDRIAWAAPATPWDADRPDDPAPTDSTVLTTFATDVNGLDFVTLVAVASTPDTRVAFPGGITPPAPGEFYASPALAERLAAVPADQWSDRYGTLIGLLPDSTLQGPSQLVALMGAEWDVLASDPSAVLQEEFTQTGGRAASLTYRFILAIGAVSILVPIILLVSIVSQLGAAERRDRFATVRLIGAGRRAIAAVSALEMAAAAGLGALAGLAVAAGLGPLAARIPINGATSFTADLAPTPGIAVGVVAAVTLLAALTAWWRTYRDDVGAPGAVRERAEKKASAWRAVPLAAGLAVYALSALGAQSGVLGSELVMVGMFGGFVVVALGIVFAGPWLTRVVSAAFGRATSSATGVVAAGRLSRHPRATFRAVSGLVIAVFIVSTFAGAASAIEQIGEPGPEPGALDNGAVVSWLAEGSDAAAVGRAVADVRGVEAVVVGHRSASSDDSRVALTPEDARTIGAVEVPDAPAVLVDTFEMLSVGTGLTDSDAVSAPEATSAVAGLEPAVIIAVTDRSEAAMARAHTAIMLANPSSLPPTSRAQFAASGSLEVTQELSVMAYIGMAIAIGISALSLTVSTVAAAIDRRRTFGLLRLSGMPVSQLRGTVATEAAVPLGATLAVSAGLGFLVAWVMIETLGNGLTVSWPDARYWIAMLGAGALAGVALIGSFGVVRKATEVETTRFE